MAKKEKNLSYTVIENVGTLSTKEYDKTNWETKKKEHIVETKELRKVAWGENAPKYEIRVWFNIDGVETGGKGVTLDDDEFDSLNFMFSSITD